MHTLIVNSHGSMGVVRQSLSTMDNEQGREIHRYELA